MVTLGLRASPQNVYFCVYDTESQRLVNLEKISIPNIFNTPEKLKYLRVTVLDIIREYSVTKACIRVTEYHPRLKPNIARVQHESIIQEAIASSSLLEYFEGTITSIASRISCTGAEVKGFIEGIQVFDNIEDWMTYSKEEREAILAAKGAEHV